MRLVAKKKPITGRIVKAGNDVNESEDGTLTVSWERILAQINVLRAFLVKFLNKL
jgi:hypothetical protein